MIVAATHAIPSTHPVPLTTASWSSELRYGTTSGVGVGVGSGLSPGEGGTLDVRDTDGDRVLDGVARGVRDGDGEVLADGGGGGTYDGKGTMDGTAAPHAAAACAVTVHAHGPVATTGSNRTAGVAGSHSRRIVTVRGASSRRPVGIGHAATSEAKGDSGANVTSSPPDATFAASSGCVMNSGAPTG